MAYNPEHVVHVVRTERQNPKRGAKARRKYQAVAKHHGHTVAELQKYWRKHKLPDSAGGELTWCAKRGWVQVLPPGEQPAVEG